MDLKQKVLKVTNSGDDEVFDSSRKIKKRIETKQKKSRFSGKLQKNQLKDKSVDENPFVDSNVPFHGFCHTGDDYGYKRDVHLLERRGNTGCYYLDESLDPLPFIDDQPEGMPCWIKKLDDIVTMSEDNVLVFLRGYGEPIDDADLSELRRRLAFAVGVPDEIANKKFNYVNEFWESLGKNTSSDEDPFVDSNLPFHGFCHTGDDYGYKRDVHLLERRGNTGCYYLDESLDPLPFIDDQPEGMPCWIKKLDDIVTMSEDNVLVFLRGYGEPIDDADLNELRRRLAFAVGVPDEIANKKFNYVNEFWKSLGKMDEEKEENDGYDVNLETV